MTMEISNQKKLSEFYEELKRLDINILRPNINSCYANFYSDEKNFYYALGAIKNVGYEAVSNIVIERTTNGPFKSITDFINRINPKDINKLQLEGLVKAGAFDNINNNRKSIYESIPKIILKSKNISENKLANQTALFETHDINNDEILEGIEDWSIDERLSKEFQSLGFYISDHPLNQYKEVFNDYNIIEFVKFNEDTKSKESNIACTVLKVQEKKTQKGSSYAIVKFSDLSSVFELFIFSEIFEMSRNMLQEGSSLLLTLTKNISEEDNRFKKINVRKITSLIEVTNKPIDKIEFIINDETDIEKLSKLFKTNGKTEVNLTLKDEGHNIYFKLKDKRQVDRKLINIIKNKGISSIIN